MYKLVAYNGHSPIVAVKFFSLDAALDAGREQLKQGRLVEVINMRKEEEPKDEN